MMERIALPTRAAAPAPANLETAPLVGFAAPEPEPVVEAVLRGVVEAAPPEGAPALGLVLPLQIKHEDQDNVMIKTTYAEGDGAGAGAGVAPGPELIEADCPTQVVLPRRM